VIPNNRQADSDTTEIYRPFEYWYPSALKEALWISLCPWP
jgi:hypothetical protein